MGDVLEFDSPDGVEQCWKAQTFPAQESSSASPGPQFPTDKTIICVQLYCIAFNVSFLFVVVLHIKAFFLPTFRFNECCALPIRQRLVNFVYILSMAVLAASALDVMSSPEQLGAHVLGDGGLAKSLKSRRQCTQVRCWTDIKWTMVVVLNLFWSDVI